MNIQSTDKVILRWLIDRNTAFACKSTKDNRIKENFDIYDFQLSQKDIEEIE